MLNLNQIVDKLHDRNLVTVSEKSGVRYATLFNIAKGKNKNPKYETVKKLSDYLQQNK
jgi:predicted transcriptional regulator